MTWHAVPALVAGLVGLGAGALVPRLIERIPEPDPDEPAALVDQADAEAPLEEPDPPVTAAGAKELYADIARRPGLAVRAAVVSGLCAALVGAAVGWEWSLLFLVPLVPVSVALAVVDWRTRLLPTWVIAPTYVVLVGLVLVVFAATRSVADLERAGWGWLVAGGLYFVLWFVYPAGMGYGDVRLSGVLGIALGQLGWAQLLVGVYGGFLIGGVLGGLLSVLRRVDRKGYPFGPFMLVGALVGVVFGSSIGSALTG